MKNVKSAPRWARRKDERPDEIVSAALEVFVERGYAATRLEDVASRAGISKGTLYLYFDNKEELFKAVVRASLVAPLEEARRFAESYEGSMAELLATQIRAWWQARGKTRHSGLPKLVIAEATNFPEIARFYFAEVIAPTQVALQKVIARGIAQGEFAPMDERTAGFLVVAPIVFAMLWQHSFGTVAPAGTLDIDQFIEAHIGLLKRGLEKE